MNSEPEKSSKIICHRPWTGFEVFDHLGDVRPCCWGKKSCGNINDQTAQQIWNGPGFQYYRDRMLEGDVDKICKPSCPIRQGQYLENIPSHIQPARMTSRIDKCHHKNPSPLFLRVVPSIACNLRCPMCYQLADPPVGLPEDLFEQLKPWISNAVELLILGGEPFLAKECLKWIERLDPKTFPNLGLAAISNGLCFTKSICELIVQRNWNWILISVDAASSDVYSKVRGGDFRLLLDGLDRLATVRARAQKQFEIRLGFTLQNSNLKDALTFLDLCADYRAVPQYTLVFGDWHDQHPSTFEEYQHLYSTLERLDKRLWELGFDNRLLAGVFAALSKTRFPNREEPSTSRFFNRGHQAVLMSGELPRKQCHLDGREDLHDTKECSQQILDQLHLSDRDGQLHLSLTANNSLKHTFEEFKHFISSIPVESFSIKLPYFEVGHAISALEMWAFVEDIKDLGAAKGWILTGGDPDPVSLGLHYPDRHPHYDMLYERVSSHNSVLTVISPIHNSERHVATFLASLQRQNVDAPCEIILVDDTSTDSSIKVILDCVTALNEYTSVKVAKTRRQQVYKRGTFTFGAGLAREIGCRLASGNRILFLDPDQYVEAECLREHLDWGNRGFDVIIGDRIERGFDLDLTWNRLRTTSLLDEPDWWLSFFTGNASVSRELMLRVGGFDTSLQYWGLDDTDLAYRLFRSNATFWHTLRARVVHLAPNESGGGTTRIERIRNYRLHMEVLYRKYLETEILRAFSFVWPG